jgi:hypothetical protein
MGRQIFGVKAVSGGVNVRWTCLSAGARGLKDSVRSAE